MHGMRGYGPYLRSLEKAALLRFYVMALLLVATATYMGSHTKGAYRILL